MHFYSDNNISIYFGDNSDQLFMSESMYENFKQESTLLTLKQFAQLNKVMSIEKIMFPRQVHGTSGFLVDANTLSTSKPFSTHGDYVITSRPGIGIGVLTADCLPILFYDKAHQAIAAIHAGWRGSVAGIATKVVNHMHTAFGTEPTDLQVFFGPAAGACCYSVGPEVINAVKPYQEQVLKEQNSEIFFDLIKYNQLVLQTTGVSPTAFCTEHAGCTICNNQYCSYRRQKETSCRHVTVISIK